MRYRVLIVLPGAAVGAGETATLARPRLGLPNRPPRRRQLEARAT